MLALTKILTVLSLHFAAPVVVPHFDAANPVASCRAAAAQGVDLAQCDDVQTETEGK